MSCHLSNLRFPNTEMTKKCPPVSYISRLQLTLPMLGLHSSKAQGGKVSFEKHLNPVMLVFIG